MFISSDVTRESKSEQQKLEKEIFLEQYVRLWARLAETIDLNSTGNSYHLTPRQNIVKITQQPVRFVVVDGYIKAMVPYLAKNTHCKRNTSSSAYKRTAQTGFVENCLLFHNLKKVTTANVESFFKFHETYQDNSTGIYRKQRLEFKHFASPKQ